MDWKFCADNTYPPLDMLVIALKPSGLTARVRLRLDDEEDLRYWETTQREVWPLSEVVAWQGPVPERG